MHNQVMHRHAKDFMHKEPCREPRSRGIHAHQVMHGRDASHATYQRIKQDKQVMTRLRILGREQTDTSPTGAELSELRILLVLGEPELHIVRDLV